MKIKQVFENLASYYFFPIMSFAIVGWLILAPSFFSLVINLIWISRLLFSQRKQLLWWGIISGFFALCFFGSVISKEQIRENLPYDVTADLVVEVEPDTISVDGDFLQMTGKIVQSSENFKKRDKLLLFYTLKNETEKGNWQGQTKPLRIDLKGEIMKAETRRNLNGFDYRHYLKQAGIYRTVTIKKFLNLESQKVSLQHPLLALKSLRKTWVNLISERLPSTLASYTKSMLFGVKDEAFKNQQDVLSELGIIHLFSLAGLHLYFFVDLFRYLLLRMGITHESLYWLLLAFLGVLCLLAGFSTSVFRVSLLLMMNLSNRRWNFGLSPLDCWSLTLLFGILQNPYVLLTMGGQLSYGLTFALIYLRPLLANFTKNWQQQLVFSLCLGGLCVPFLWHYYFQWHLLSLLLVFLLYPFVSQIILPILTVSFVGILIVPNLGQFWLIKMLEQLLNSFHGGLAWIAEHFSFLQMVTGVSHNWQFLGSLLVAGYLLHNWRKWQKSYKKVLIIIVVFCAIVGGKYLQPSQQIAFIDVGQGDSIFVQDAFHQGNYLIDTGGRMEFQQEAWQIRKGSTTNAEKTLIPFLKSQGVKKLDLVFITHADADHCGDLEKLAEFVEIEEIIYPEGCEEKSTFRLMMNRLKKQNIKFSAILAGKTYGNKSLTFHTLYPFKKGKGENNDSLVLYTEVAGTKFLLTGDLEKAGEADLLKHYSNLQVDVLKAGHHGSRSSTSETFIQQIKPKQTIISCGKNNRYGHPHQEVLATFNKYQVQTFATSQQGMIYYRHYFWQKHLSKIQTVKKLAPD